MVTSQIKRLNETKFTLFHQELAEHGSDLSVGSRDDSVQELNHLDLTAESLVDGAELQTNDTTADNDEFLGDSSQGKGTCKKRVNMSLEMKETSRGDDLLLVEGNAWEGSGFRAGGNDDVLGVDGALFAVGLLDLDDALAGDFGGTLDVLHLVLTE